MSLLTPLKTALGGALIATVAMVGSAAAQNAGVPYDGQTGFQSPATGVMETIVNFEAVLNYLIILITLFVFGLLAYAMVKFREGKNDKPSQRTHNTFLEVAWTAIPVLILMVMAVPSFQLLWDQKVIPDGEREYTNAGVLPAPGLTIKAIGHRWNWEYEYPDHEGLNFTSFMKEEKPVDFDPETQKDEDFLMPGEPRLLAVDNEVVVPVGTTVRLLITASDVLHSFAMPAFGVKVDAVPGRINETWFNAKKEGIYYGQCSEICGMNHAFMPIAIRVVSEAEFAEWLVGAKQEFASVPATDEKTLRLARR